MIRATICILALAVGLAGCNRDGGKSRPLLNLRGSSVAPDEFLVTPQAPLAEPANYADLPEPEPGAPSLTVIDNQAPMFAALGGRAPVSRGAIPAADQALVAAVQSRGTIAGIRETLAAEDRAFRENRARRVAKQTEKLNLVSIYEFMLLDPYAEMERLRALGVRVPAAPAP